MGARRRTVAAVLACVASAWACSTLNRGQDGADDGGRPDGGAEDARVASGSEDAGDAGAASTCRALPLRCLDPSAPGVIEVPTETTLADALLAAGPGEVIQVNAAALTVDFAIPEGVTLRGCAGAKITAVASFAAGTGTLEGFVVSGSVFAEKSGSFVIRHNRFVVASTPSPYESVRARSSEADSEDVTLLVDANRFENVSEAIRAETMFVGGPRKVTVTVRNNYFHSSFAFRAVNDSGTISPTLEHNTFYGFDTAMAFANVAMAETRANLFVRGSTAITSPTGAYSAHDSIAWLVADPYFKAPTAGTITVADPRLSTEDGGEGMLLPGSPAIDAVSGAGGPAEDLAGCPRPAGTTSPRRSDVGAFERQP